MAEMEATFENGYALGRPTTRERQPLDAVIEQVIGDLPAQVRLYPDVYSWKVTDAVEHERNLEQEVEGSTSSQPDEEVVKKPSLISELVEHNRQARLRNLLFVAQDETFFAWLYPDKADRAKIEEEVRRLLKDG